MSSDAPWPRFTAEISSRTPASPDWVRVGSVTRHEPLAEPVRRASEVFVRRVASTTTALVPVSRGPEMTVGDLLNRSRRALPVVAASVAVVAAVSWWRRR